MKRNNMIGLICFSAIIVLLFISGCSPPCTECAGRAFKVLAPGGAASTCEAYTKDFCEGDVHVTSVRAVDCKITTSREECP
ncbi:MAG: hypothetical protein ABIA62_04205, partial [Candidatus Woesearchaeota archaeon]